MCGRSYRPRPANGSGDSPRPPFLSEFVNHIGKLTLVEVVYHLFGGTFRPRVHPHVERSIRLKTESARRVIELQTAHSDVRQQAVGYRASGFGQACKRCMPQLDAWPIRLVIPSEGFRFATRIEVRSRGTSCWLLTRQPPSRNLQRRRILIEPNQMSRCAEAFCDFVTVPAQAHRSVDISPATPHVQKVDRFF